MPSSNPTYWLTLLLASCAAAPAEYGERLEAWKREHEERREIRASEAELAADAELSDLLAHARASNPGLAAAFQRWKEALERVPAASALPEPRLTLSGYLAEVETRTGPMRGRVGLAQPFPWFGTRELAGELAFAEAEAERARLEVVRLELDERVRTAFAERLWLERAIAITAGNRELLLHWESVARARLESGIGAHADVIRAQVELGKIEDRVQGLRDLARPLEAELNAALGRAPGAQLSMATRALPAVPTLDEARLQAQLASTSPALLAEEQRVRAAEHALELAGKAYYPGFSIGADYTFIGSSDTPGVSGSGDDAVALTLGLDLPVWRSSYRAAERAAEARLIAARHELEDAVLRLGAELEMALYHFRDGNRRVELFRDSLVPKGEEAVQALDVAYQSGDQGFLDLIDAQRALLEFQLEAVRAETDRAQALAAIERITGERITGERITGERISGRGMQGDD